MIFPGQFVSDQSPSSLLENFHKNFRTGITIDMGWVNAGQRVKVALVWDSTPTSDYLTDPLKADLDLYVYGPNQYQYSVSWDNSYEVVDFTAAASGNFQIKVKNFRFDGINEYLAVAWSLS